MDALNLQHNYETSSSELKTKAPKESLHGRRRSNTESSIPQLSTLNSSLIEEKPSSSSSTQLRGEYGQKRSRNLSFYKVPLLNTTASSSNAKQSPRSARPDNLETYFDDLFACDSEKASQFVIALTTRGYSWGIPVLNAASSKDHVDIAKTLFENLSPKKLISVFAEVFKLDTQEKWCRGNQLIYTLLQQYIAQPSLKDYKKSVWDAVFMLRQPIDKISIKQRDSIQFTAKSFSAEQQDINALQQAFAFTVKQILAPQNIPPLMQEIIKCAYHDLVNRSDIKRDYGTLMRTLMTPFVLRFISPIIIMEAEQNLTLDNLNTLGVINLQTEDKGLCEQKLTTLKTWYKTIITAIQALNSPLKNTNEKQSKPNGTWIDQQLGQQSLATEMFDTVTQDELFRIELYEAIEKGLQLEPISSVTPTYDDSQIPSLKPAIIELLSELLMTEEFSGLTFRKDGAVTSPRKEGKASVFSVFAVGPTTPTANDLDASLNSPRSSNAKGK